MLSTAPVYQSIIDPLKVFGLPRTFGIMLATTTVSMVVMLGAWWFAFISAVLYIVGREVGKLDPYFFSIFFEVIKLKDVYD